MEITPEFYNITDIYISPTLRQEFSDGTNFPTNVHFGCNPIFDFEKHKEKNIAVLTMKWFLELENFLDYKNEIVYKVDYTNYLNDEEMINDLIIESLQFYFAVFKERVEKLDLLKMIPVEFLGPQTIGNLRNEIVIRLQRKEWIL